MIERRTILKAAVLGLLAAVVPGITRLRAEITAKIEKTTEEWRALLPEKQFRILREEATEPPFTSELLHEKRRGLFVCAGCDLPLFPSAYKYDSGTGWPSFFDVLPRHIGTKIDRKTGYPRTEYHCARCGGHHGHVFEDGPPPTGLRYCSNGAVLKFIPEKK